MVANAPEGYIEGMEYLSEQRARKKALGSGRRAEIGIASFIDNLPYNHAEKKSFSRRHLSSTKPATTWPTDIYTEM